MKNTQYSSSELLYSERPTIKIGGRLSNTYRGLLFFDIKQYIENGLQAVTGYTTGTKYSVLNANLTITSSEGATGGNIYAFMLPLGACADESASWYKPSEKVDLTWEDGGTVEPLAESISPVGTWNEHDVSFDITPFVNIWMSSPQNPMGIMLTSDETTDTVLQFHSQQAITPLLGGSLQTNAVFIGAGDSTTISTEGIVVKISPYAPYITLESANSSDSESKRWSALNASISTGNTLSISLPDLGLSPNTYTLVDKRIGASGIQFVLSGPTAGLQNTLHTTAEFQCNGNATSGYGIVEFYSPSKTLLTDFSTLVSGETVVFNYTPTISPNNAKSYTLDFYADETQNNNRARLYLKEQTASENRSGLLTEVKRNSVRPRVSMSLAF